MSSTLQSLQALKAIAAWDMGEAAVSLSKALGVQTQVQARAKTIGEQTQAIGKAYGRATQPGQRLQLAAVNLLYRQAHASQGVQAHVGDELRQATEVVDGERETLAKHRARDDALHKLIKHERHLIEAERAKAEYAVLDDLYLARRWVMEALV
ncbi:MAG: hypothetical protein V4532_12395 [Pseudomonadota bacterium]